GALVGHQRQLAEVDLLAALLPDRLRLRFLVVIEDDEAQRHLERNREGHATVVALLDRVLRIAKVIRVELQQGIVVVVGDREHRLEHGLQPDLLTPVCRDVLLQERLVRPLLNLDQIRDLDDRRNLPEVLAAAPPALNRACHSHSPENEGSLPVVPPARDYLTWTVAPCSSSFFFMSSASALVTFSLTGFGAPSTRSLASFRPSPVSSRTTLMTWIFFSPAAPRMTSNSVFSSVAAAPPAAPAPLALPRCESTYTSSRCGACSRPTSWASGPWMAPTICARSVSFDGRSARALSPAGSSIWPST